MNWKIALIIGITLTAGLLGAIGFQLGSVVPLSLSGTRLVRIDSNARIAVMLSTGDQPDLNGKLEFTPFTFQANLNQVIGVYILAIPKNMIVEKVWLVDSTEPLEPSGCGTYGPGSSSRYAYFSWIRLPGDIWYTPGRTWSLISGTPVQSQTGDYPYTPMGHVQGDWFITIFGNIYKKQAEKILGFPITPEKPTMFTVSFTVIRYAPYDNVLLPSGGGMPATSQVAAGTQITLIAQPQQTAEVLYSRFDRWETNKGTFYRAAGAVSGILQILVDEPTWIKAYFGSTTSEPPPVIEINGQLVKPVSILYVNNPVTVTVRIQQGTTIQRIKTFFTQKGVVTPTEFELIKIDASTYQVQFTLPDGEYDVDIKSFDAGNNPTQLLSLTLGSGWSFASLLSPYATWLILAVSLLLGSIILAVVWKRRES